MESTDNLVMGTSKSDEEFEQQHTKYKEKVLTELQKQRRKCSGINKTNDHLASWYRHIEERKKIIKHLKTKSTKRKCTMLETDFDKSEAHRKITLLSIARVRHHSKQCKTLHEVDGIPKYIKENDLLLKCTRKQAHKHCTETYFEDQLKLNHSLHMKNKRKFPNIDELIVVGRKIEPLSPLVSTEVISCEDDVDDESRDQCVLSLNSLDFSEHNEHTPLTICSESYSSESSVKPKEYCDNELEYFFKKSFALDVISDIFDSILNEICKQNVFFLKMNFSSLHKGIENKTSKEMDENNEYSTIESTPSNLVQNFDGEKKSQKEKTKNFRECSFERSSDYMLLHIENKMKSKDYAMNYLGCDRAKKIDEYNQLKKANMIEAYWSNMFLNMLDKFYQIQKHIILTNGLERNILSDFSKTSSTKINSNTSKSIKSSKIIRIMSKARNMHPSKNKSTSRSMSLPNSLLRLVQREKLFLDQIRNSPMFKSMLYLQFRNLILEAIDYVCDVSETTF